HKLMLLKNRYATIIKNENLQSFLKNLSSIFVYDFFLWIYILFFEPMIIFRFVKELKFLYQILRRRG
ncbi:MAG: hypothetical protein NC898_00510, partial [Candidatus Omnitrophica bacterium]|nr:hypothetical protein [Candidatus Omnitrophota bacterium]